VIGVDIDEVCALYVAGCIDKHGWPDSFSEYPLIKTWPDADWNDHFGNENQIEFIRSLMPVDGAFSGIHILINAGFPVVYITSRDEEVKEASLEWLDQWGFPVAPLYCAQPDQSKMDIIELLDVAAIIEDNPTVLQGARDLGIATFIMDRPWNWSVPGLYRCFGWTHILHTIDKYWLPIG